MKKTIFPLILLLFIINGLFAQNGWRKAEMEVKVFIENTGDASKLHGLHFNGDLYPDGYAVIYVTPEEVKQLELAGLHYEIRINDLNEYYHNFWKNRDEYHSYQEIVNLADSLAQHFPGICKKYLFGTSVLGRELGALKISDNPNVDETEAEVMFDAGIHGDETICSEIVIRFARKLCLSYNNDPDITELINSREIWLFYMVNPDGRVSMSRYNHNGVDLNRDAGYMWNQEGSSTGAFSQVESKALRECTFTNQFVIHTTYHSGTEYISYPWSYRPDVAADKPHIHFLASVYSSTSNYPTLTYGQGNTGMYPINGSTKDSNYGIMGSVSWSMEISYQKQPPTSQIMTYYNYNEPAMLAMIENAGYGIEGIITDASTGDPVSALVFINDFFPCYADPEIGDYHKFVLPGTYSIMAIANGYQTTTIDNVTVTENNASVINIQLQPEEGRYVYKIISSQIPGNNFADEGHTPSLLGAPDNINYSIGRSGWLVVDMQYPIIDGPGEEITVYEGDDTPEGFTLFIGLTMEGPWLELGTGTGTTSFDIYGIASYGSRFLKISDDGNGFQTEPDAGFDLDAIKIASAPGMAINPDPPDGQNNIEPFTSLFWEPGSGGAPTYYKIYLGTDNPPSNIINGDSISSTSFALPLVLDFETHYFWRVDAGNYGGCTQGEVWDFTTIYPPDEDFETGDFSLYNWTFEGDATWEIDNSTAFFGTHSARSGNINDNQSSSLKITLDVETFFSSLIQFRKKTSTATGDKLQFLIDGTVIDEWSGMSMFSEESFLVDDGLHTFEWKYIKNENASSGDDCVWIDYIYFPPLAPPSINAGEDTSTCFDTGIGLNGFATNYCYLEWSTSGTGAFDDPSLLNPTYTPSDEDALAGTVILTLTVYAGENVLTDSLILSITPLPDIPSTPSGPDYIDLFYTSTSEYSTGGAANAESYLWVLSPEEAGSISGTGLIATVEWNTDYLGVVYIAVTGINECGESEPSEILEVIVDNTVGMDPETKATITCTVLPNPSNGNFVLKIHSKGKTTLSYQIINAQGAVVFYMKEVNFQGHYIESIDLSAYKSGIYYLYLVTEVEVIIKRIILID